MYIALEVLKKDLEHKYPNLVKYVSKFSESAISFQVKTGLISDVKDLYSLYSSLSVQTDQVSEEMLEFYHAVILGDKVEAVDGLVDVIFTMVNFDFITQNIFEITGENEILDNEISHIKNEYKYLIKEVLDDFLSMGIKEKDIINSAKIIEINNSNKYTNNLQEAINWDIDLSDGLATHIVATPVDEEVYFCLKDKNGKVRKHKNFKKFDLNFLNKEEVNDE